MRRVRRERRRTSKRAFAVVNGETISYQDAVMSDDLNGQIVVNASSLGQ